MSCLQWKKKSSIIEVLKNIGFAMPAICFGEATMSVIDLIPLWEA
jgi:hypothetical protein